MDTEPITAQSLARPYRLVSDEFERAYKEHLSGFREWEKTLEGQSATDVMLFPTNIGPNDSIDETSLSNGELYTIVSNKDAHGKKGALIAMVKGTKADEVAAQVRRIPLYEREKATEITMDFSESMHSIVSQSFPHATITIDRFHMQKLAIDALQELRVKYRREAQKVDIEARQQHRFRNKRNKAKRQTGKKDPRGRKPNRANEQYHPETLENGDTRLELLARSRYLLSTSADKWSASQKERARLLWKLYPDLHTAYGLVQSLRSIFNKKDHTRESAKAALAKWYNKVTEFDNDAFNTVSATIYCRKNEILNFFTNRAINASAESLNSKIKLFRTQLRGVSDVRFFLYRLKLIFG
ncbi:MAG: transposase [Paludibacteraceae bacterium]|nr:transposase [Paludibacteraceae bacterium]